jgi:hypothetical protein
MKKTPNRIKKLARRAKCGKARHINAERRVRWAHRIQEGAHA